MKDLDEKAKLEDTLQSAPPPKFTKVSVHPSAGKAYVPRASTRRANSRFSSSSSASKNLCRFPTMDNLSTTSGEKGILSSITLDFCSQAFCSNYTPRCSLTAEGAKVVDAEIKLILLKHVISPAELKADSFISSIFTTMKPDGSHQTILNLKNLNESITYVHFKMESLKHVR